MQKVWSGFAQGHRGLRHAGWSLWHQHTLHTQSLAGKCESWSRLKHMVTEWVSQVFISGQTCTPMPDVFQIPPKWVDESAQFYEPLHSFRPSDMSDFLLCCQIKFFKMAKLFLRILVFHCTTAERCLGKSEDWCYFSFSTSNKQKEKCRKLMTRCALQLAGPALKILVLFWSQPLGGSPDVSDVHLGALIMTWEELCIFEVLKRLVNYRLCYL